MSTTSRREIEQPLWCLVHPNTCTSYLVYRPAGSTDGALLCWPIRLQHDYDIIQTRHQVAEAVTYSTLRGKVTLRANHTRVRGLTLASARAVTRTLPRVFVSASLLARLSHASARSLAALNTRARRPRSCRPHRACAYTVRTLDSTRPPSPQSLRATKLSTPSEPPHSL